MSETIETLYSAVTTEVEQLRTQLGEGVVSSAETLDPKMTALMNALQAAPKDVGKSWLPRLMELNQSLSELQADFRRQQAGAESSMQELGTRLKAATAYATSAARGSKGESEKG
jgi:hypothetical protein